MCIYILCVYEPMEKGVRATHELLTMVPRVWVHSRGGRPALPIEGRWPQEGQRDAWPCLFPALHPSPRCPDETCPLPTDAPEVSALPWAHVPGRVSSGGAQCWLRQRARAAWVGDSSIFGTWSTSWEESPRLRVDTFCWPWRLLGTPVRLSLQSRGLGAGASVFQV